MQGKKQAATSLQRYHILCAAIQGKYVVTDIVPIVPTAPSGKCIKPEVSDTSDQHLDPGSESDADDNIWPLVRGTINFSAYKEFKLHPIKNVELPEVGADGDVSWWGLYALYEIALNDDWRTREGGILRAVAEYDDFFSCMLSYNSSSPKWAGVVKWDTLFEKLHNSGYRKNIIPCMVRVLRSITNITGYNCCHSFLARRMDALIRTAHSSMIARPFSLIARKF